MNDDDTIAPQDEIINNQPLEIQLDWEAYFIEFCNKHGKYPVVYGKEKQLLLFPDGWTYDAINYEGPEYPPPKDKYQLARLQFYYWSRRYRIVKLELITVESDLNYLTDIERSKSLPLQQVIEYQTEDGKVNRNSQQLDLTALRQRKTWLEGDKRNSKTMMEIHQNNMKKAIKDKNEALK